MSIQEFDNRIKQGVILKSSKFSESMTVINEPKKGDGYILVDLVGTNTQTFRGGVSLSEKDLQSIVIESSETNFSGNIHIFRLGFDALRIKLAYEYDPFFGLSISKIDKWCGQLPKDKWNLISHRVLAKFGTSENVIIEVTIRASIQDPSIRQQLNSALRELGLESEFLEIGE